MNCRYEALAFVIDQRRESTKAREAFFLEFAERIRPHLSTAKLCVTGGFRTLSVMNGALADRACDLIGLGRPLCAEPSLCRELLAGTRTTAKANLVNPQISTFIGGAQIVQISRGETIADLSTPEGAKAATEALMAQLSSKL
jgi:hypothetical protein